MTATTPPAARNGARPIDIHSGPVVLEVVVPVHDVDVDLSTDLAAVGALTAPATRAA
ncbi:hypothetical protein UO65_0653 [Actinokineospora spheciospongiae]|uniref:Uncharacterized protein n=1 Tax=Actinokineospora spheciospongiae TaxID=909613 RepID=W7J4Q7_9PSEU|nr:hypothetical protein [Actinokineospora spheciospongiae]EWC64032.1 hypothetical protein UO65_0653 [Actinokineospora spheciospongiae]